MNIAETSKKELKDYINKNGFYFHLKVDKIDKNLAIQKDAITTGKEVPKGDNIIIFEGIASMNYEKGEKSRNGYKYNQDGWDFTDYNENPLILWQHDASYGGIGHAISFGKNDNGDLTIRFYVDLDALDEKSKVQVDKGYVTAISTGAIPLEIAYEENETGDKYSEQEAEDKFGWENVWEAMFGQSDILTLIIEKASMLENSLVTIGSNAGAIVQKNGFISIIDGISNHMESLADTYKTKHKIDKVEEITDEAIDEVGQSAEKKDNEIEDVELEEEIKEENEVIEDKIETPKTNPKTDEIKSGGKMSIDNFEKEVKELKDFMDSIKQDYISNERFTELEKDLKDSLEKTFNSEIDSLKKEMKTKSDELSKNDEALLDAFTNMLDKLKGTVFKSADMYEHKEDEKLSSLGQKLNALKY